MLPCWGETHVKPILGIHGKNGTIMGHWPGIGSTPTIRQLTNHKDSQSMFEIVIGGILQSEHLHVLWSRPSFFRWNPRQIQGVALAPLVTAFLSAWIDYEMNISHSNKYSAIIWDFTPFYHRISKSKSQYHIFHVTFKSYQIISFMIFHVSKYYDSLHSHLKNFKHHFSPLPRYPISLPIHVPGLRTVSAGWVSTWCSACAERTRTFKGCMALPPAAAMGCTSPVMRKSKTRISCFGSQKHPPSFRVDVLQSFHQNTVTMQKEMSCQRLDPNTPQNVLHACQPITVNVRISWTRMKRQASNSWAIQFWNNGHFIFPNFLPHLLATSQAPHCSSAYVLPNSIPTVPRAPAVPRAPVGRGQDQAAKLEVRCPPAGWELHATHKKSQWCAISTVITVYVAKYTETVELLLVTCLWV